MFFLAKEEVLLKALQDVSQSAISASRCRQLNETAVPDLYVPKDRDAVDEFWQYLTTRSEQQVRWKEEGHRMS